MGEFSYACCPYGRFSAVPILLAYAAVGLIAAASFSCHFYLITDVFQPGKDHKMSGSMTFGIGLWRVESVDSTGGLNVQCNDWTSHAVLDREDMDGSMHFARFVSMTTVLGGLVLSFVLLGLTCCTFPTWLLKSMAIISLIGGVFSMLTLVALSSKFCQDAEDCELGYAGILSIVAFGAWICTGMFLFLLKNTRSTGQSQPQPSQVAPVLGAESFEESETSYDHAGSKIVMNSTHVIEDGSTVTAEDVSSREVVVEEIMLQDDEEASTY